MVKVSTNINYIYWAFLLPMLFSFCFSANGQYQDSMPSSAALDTIVSIEEEIEAGASNRFEIITQEDQQPVLSRSVDTHKVIQLQKDDAFWYINKAPEKVEKQVKQPRKVSTPSPEWLRNLLWVLVVGGFVVLIIWFLVVSDVQLFRKPPPVQANQDEEEEFATENLFDIDYESALGKAIAAQNYRQAIRLLYLQTLRDMALRNIILYRQERTNSDYLMQLFNTSYYKDFFRLTRNFEYAWYGQFEVSLPLFEQIKNDFSSFRQRMLS